MKALIDHVNQLGMKFGLWVEPEMVNPNSDLYRAHPDWAMHFPGRPRTEERNQLILNMARDDVKEYIFDVLDRLLAENNIEFLKWDMNRHFTEPGWPDAPARRTEGDLGQVRAATSTRSSTGCAPSIRSSKSNPAPAAAAASISAS